MEQDRQTDETAADTQGRRPIHRLTGSGGLTVAVWKNQNEDGSFRYSIQVDRTYKADNDEFQNTNMLRDRDLLRVSSLLQQADEWIENDKGRLVGRSSEVAR